MKKMLQTVKWAERLGRFQSRLAVKKRLKFTQLKEKAGESLRDGIHKSKNTDLRGKVNEYAQSCTVR
jgi:hypothetical protein